MATIHVIGAGITGLWQSLTLARRGHRVRLSDTSDVAFANAASRLGAAMLAPYCEAESAGRAVQELGVHSLGLWRATYPDLIANGTIVIAPARDQPELQRFAKMTENGVRLDQAGLAEYEPMLAERHRTALYYPDEAHVEPSLVLPWLLNAATDAGCEMAIGGGPQSDWTIDCRGMGAASDLRNLRGVKGEMLVVETREISLSRPVRLLHPRFPLYIAPWQNHRFMIGATVIESAERGSVSVRSALDLLSAAFAVHPSFAEARIEGFFSDVRPAFPDNIPKIEIRERTVHVNGVYRHGYLLAPGLAELVADHIEGRPSRHLAFFI